MVDIKELRIGNWVNDFGDGYCRVNGIWQEDIATTIHDYPMLISNFEPILLTPAILEKCGFVKHPYEKMPTYSDYRLGKMVVSPIGDDEESFEIEYSGVRIVVRTYLCTITSLHQLQNLVFALTGTELNIEL